MVAPICRVVSTQSLLRAAVKRTLLKLGVPVALAALFAVPAFGADPIKPADVPANGQNGFHNGRDNNNSGDFPASDIHVAVEANARLTHARVTYHHLQDSFNQTLRLMQTNFERSPELVDALKAEQAAWQDYLAARSAAVKTVVDDPKYQASVTLKNEMGEQIAETRATYDESRPHGAHAAAMYDQTRMKKLVTLATVKLDYAQVVTDMEVTALKSDPKVADTRGKLMTAGKRVRDMRDGFDNTIRNSPDLASLRAKIADAKIAYITAESFRDGAVEAANTALDYAYYKNRYSGNGSYGFEYGYSGGYR